jgi:hypothetical protein
VATEWQDALELVLVPALAAVLPWRWCFKVFQWVARHSRLYDDACQAALRQAQALGWVTDPVHFVYVRRLVTLTDHADLYLALTRGNGWMLRHLSAEVGHSPWPVPGQAALLCTFHWGAGMWGLRHAAQAGLRPHALVAATHGEPFKGRTVLGAYARWRTGQVQRTLGQVPLDVSASLRPAVQALKHNQVLLAAIDAPADQADGAEIIRLLDLQARVPRALLRAAARQRLPVCVYATGLNIHTGQRTLRVVALPPTTDALELTHRVFAELEICIRQDPPAWHFWSEAPRIFVNPPQ